MGGFSQVRVPFMTRAVCETAAMYNMVQRKLVADSKSAVVPKTPGIQLIAAAALRFKKKNTCFLDIPFKTFSE